MDKAHDDAILAFHFGIEDVCIERNLANEEDKQMSNEHAAFNNDPEWLKKKAALEGRHPFSADLEEFERMVKAPEFAADVEFIHACHINGALDMACAWVFDRRAKEVAEPLKRLLSEALPFVKASPDAYREELAKRIEAAMGEEL